MFSYRVPHPDFRRNGVPFFDGDDGGGGSNGTFEKRMTTRCGLARGKHQPKYRAFTHSSKFEGESFRCANKCRSDAVGMI